jgi:hypothetical protein
MVGHSQIEFEQCEQGAHKPFHFAIGQMEHFFHRQHDANGLVAIVKLRATLFCPNIAPGLCKVIGQPEGDRTTLDQRFLVARPVLDTV